VIGVAWHLLRFGPTCRALRAGCGALALLALAACSSLPRVVPDLARHARPAPQLVGARGPLTAAQSLAVLERLRSRSPDSDLLTRHLALEEAVVGSPLTTGNEVRLLQDGPATYRAMLAAIEGARDHVHMETYILDDDAVGRQFARALIARQRAGVQVHLIRDSVGTLGTPAAFFDELEASGVQVLEFNPINPAAVRKDWQLNQRDHRKLLIVDGRIAFLGGINISGVYASGSFGKRRPAPLAPADAAASSPDESLPWRDTDLQLRGPVVAELQKLFIATWQAQRGEPLPAKNHFPPPEAAGQQVVRAIGSSPEEPYSQIYATLLPVADSSVA